MKHQLVYALDEIAIYDCSTTRQKRFKVMVCGLWYGDFPTLELAKRYTEKDLF